MSYFFVFVDFGCPISSVGETNIKDKLLKGHRAGDMTYKVHLDGFNLMPYFTDKEDKSRRNEFFYFNDDAELVNIRQGDWKFVFGEQRAHSFAVWSEPFVWLRIPKIFNLRRDQGDRIGRTIIQ
ncbi:hypothetical protein [Endozoicomonas sp.]|uniref:hypothetical protein n=1 Tax=Endozoicomonas sp. TaxID=1892382 RepID=UPI00383BB41D